jgi:hypothetical protein
MHVDPSRPRDLAPDTSEPAHDAPSVASPAASRASSPPAAPPPAALALATVTAHRNADASVRRFVEASREPSTRALASTSASTSAKPRLGDGVLYVGMNGVGAQCDREAALLARSGRGVRVSIAHGERDARLGADRALVGGVAIELGTEEGAQRFARALGLSSAAADQIAAVLFAAPSGSRDELAGIACVFARGERGEDVPSRLVLSGHSVGNAVYDGAGALGALRFVDVFALARAMPRAAAQIEDVMLSACNSGHEHGDDFQIAIGAWAEPFPNLKTVWGYAARTDSHSPTGDIALAHIEAWEIATRGRQEHVDARGAIVRANGRSVGFEANVHVWSRTGASRASASGEP